ncbi:MAG: metallophosphoesterase [archaeon]|nr:metallophosphoesterase [archaeon]
MKILAISDIHGDQSFMKEMAEKGAKEKVDLVVIAGDIFNFDQHKEGMIGPFKAKGLEVAIIPGNHEGLAEINALAEHYKIKNIHGYSLRIGDVGIFGCGYADIMRTLSEDEFFETLRKAHEEIKDAKKKLMVTHIEPNDSIISMKTIGWGSKGVRRAIEEFKPDIHICGHIHETHGIEEKIGNTKVINVGKSGKIIEL